MNKQYDAALRAIMNKQYDNLKDIWLNINTINDLFRNWSDKYIIGRISSCIHGFYNNGIFSKQIIIKYNWQLELNPLFAILIFKMGKTGKTVQLLTLRPPPS